jgi:ABC-type branched-subunit amino acid transport system permease subunit
MIRGCENLATSFFVNFLSLLNPHTVFNEQTIASLAITGNELPSNEVLAHFLRRFPTFRLRSALRGMNSITTARIHRMVVNQLVRFTKNQITLLKMVAQKSALCWLSSVSTLKSKSIYSSIASFLFRQSCDSLNHSALQPVPEPDGVVIVAVVAKPFTSGPRRSQTRTLP